MVLFILDRYQGCFNSGWPPGTISSRIAERLVRMFSFAGDMVLDPFLGTGSTTIAAVRAGRNSIGNEIEPKYLNLAWERVRKELDHPRVHGSCEAGY